MPENLDVKPSNNVKNDSDKQSVITALELIEKNSTAKNKHDGELESIKELFEDTFTISHPKAPKRLNGHMLYQAIWRMANRMKFLDFAIHGEGGQPRHKERIVTEGVQTVLNRGGLSNIFRGKMGTAFNMLLYGDGFFMFGSNPKKKAEMPISFFPLSSNSIHVDNNAVGVRVGDRRSATRMCPIFNYTLNQFATEFPGMEKIVGAGKIAPKNIEGDLEKTIDQDQEKKDEIDVGYLYDINSDPTFTIFAGSGNTILKELKGKDYPFMLDGEPYIPVSQWMGIPSAEGFYNYGIGHLVYKLTIIVRELFNMELDHLDKNIHPTELISVPQGKEAEFFGKLEMAERLRSKGKRAYVAMGRDPNNPNANAVSSQTLLSQNLYNEFISVWERLDRELSRMGINLDESNRGEDVTATQILAEEESANSWIKQVMEYNAGEAEFIVNATMQNIRDFVPKSNKTPLNLTTRIPVKRQEEVIGPDGQPQLVEVEDQARADSITLGDVADELKKKRYFTKVNSRTGAIPSNLLLQSQASKLLSLAQPGSKAQKSLTGQLSELNDIDLDAEDYFAPAQGPEVPQAGAAPDAGGPIPTDTDRRTFLPRKQQQSAAL